MRNQIVFALAACVVLSISTASRGEVKTVWDRNDDDRATSKFKFKGVPSPSKTDAAAKARFTIVDGRMDENSGDLDALNDGRLPDNEDQPDANFFFADGTNGGRIAADLGELVEVKQVNTYSWHPNTRGAQVYKLYASDGSAKDFDAKPARRTDPEKAGWKLIASVDTRPKMDSPGGQYGVSVFESGGDALGKYRYLLFDISRTEDEDPFGNTFFSEIDVSDGKELAAAVEDSVPPADTGKYEITFDTSEVPELKEWVDVTLRPECEKWYPIIVEMLPSEGYAAARRITVTFKKDMRGVAATSGTRISCAGGWFQKNLNGDAAGAVIHEMVHIVQRYGRARGGNSNSNPGWLVEGVADYIRWFNYEPQSKRPHPNPARAKYTDSYRTTAALLNYIAETHDKEIVKKFNAAMRQGKYAPELWKDYTGKTVDELWADYIETLKKE